MLKVLDDMCKPTKGSKYSAAIDLYAREDVFIGAGETAIVGLGVCIDLDMFIYENFSQLPLEYILRKNVNGINNFLKSHYLQLEPRSSLRVKGIQAGTGIIDLDYKDEIMIILHNPAQVKQIVQNCTNYTLLEDAEDCEYEIKKGDKIAQIMLCEHKTGLMGIDTEEERLGGFGSTGK